MNQLLVKFCSYFEDGTHTTFSVACQSYSSHTTISGVTYVTLYNGMTQVDGVSYSVCSDGTWEELCDEDKNLAGSYYQSCYVENSAGKTINKF